MFYDLSKPKIIHYIFVSIILKKHRDIFSNMFLSHPNILRLFFNTIHNVVTLTLYDMGATTKENILKIKREGNKMINQGFMGNTDLNILKNIYGNFLKTRNLLSLLTSIYISFTSQLPENDYTFNNIPFVTAMQKFLPLNVELGLKVGKKDSRIMNLFASRLTMILHPIPHSLI